MKLKLTILLLLCQLSMVVKAQNIGVNNPTPDASSILDLTSTSRGFLLPRMITAQRTGIAAPATSLLVYDITLNRFMFYDGAAWNGLLSSATGWQITGNSGTTPGTNFLGTIDKKDVVFKSFNTEVMRLDTNLAMGINQATPDIKSILHITSTAKGVLLPRMTSLQRTTLIANGSATDASRDGLLVYDTNLKNFLSWNSTALRWDTVLTRTNGSGLYWALLGNGGTSPLTNFIGTTDSTDLVFRTNNTERFRIKANGLFFTNNQGAGPQNIFFGDSAGFNITTGANNAGLGLAALRLTTIGYNNSALGSYALENNLSGYNNTGVGIESLRNNTTGYGNTSVGERSSYGNTTAYGNTSVGRFALFANQTGNENVAIGDSTLAGATNSGFSNVAVGNNALYRNTSNQNVALGFETMRNSANTLASSNVAIGYRTMLNSNNSFVRNNVVIGTNAGADIQTMRNVAIGDGALQNLNVAAKDENVAIGYNALQLDNSADRSIAIGAFAMSNAQATSNDIAIGSLSLNSTFTGNGRIAIGASALLNDSSGYRNVAVGISAMRDSKNGHFNVAIGSYAANTPVYGCDSNTVVGAEADVAGNNINNAATFGYNTVAWASNTQRFGNAGTLKWGFGVNTAAVNALQVGTSAANGNGARLTVGGVWTNASDRSLKEDFSVLDKSDILSRINQLDITRWKYIGTIIPEYHIGPIAQDFYRLFKVGTDSCSISTIDPAGVALGGIQQLSKELDVMKKQNTDLQNSFDQYKSQSSKEIEELKKMVEFLKAKIEK